MSDLLKTGVCYYPEHWPESRWAEDAAHMRRLGLGVVRIGEFAWSRYESPDGSLHFDWLERALDVLHAAGLEVVLGTPTATPPAWLVARHPGMLAVDEHGRTRGFGSRRHYCFSYAPYHEDCRRIVTAMATRFGEHPAVIAWQTDNEYGCHDTVQSYSGAAIEAFRHWCEARYGSVRALNHAWGNVFWSMEYASFEEIGAPVGAVTETGPAHRLAYWRFSSDQVVAFNRLQVDIIRAHSPGRDVVHNFMGNFVEFDHHAVSKDLDVATWDNYPLGFLTRDGADEGERERYLRTGTPDGSAFHHDLYRGCCGGRFWVMEQQPGPVNWAPWNPAPIDGMVRLWGWEAFAHGAELMSWFRWRQAPFAQEQAHTGLLLSNGDEDVGAAEVARVAGEIEVLQAHPGVDLATRRAPVAIVFDYAGDRVQRIQQPDGRHYDPLLAAHRVHSSLRRLGLDVDVIAPDAPLDGYACLFLVNSSIDDEALATRLETRLATGETALVLLPRSASKTSEYAIPDALPPGALQRLIDVQVVRTETLPPWVRLETSARLGSGPGGAPIVVEGWRERIRSPLAPRSDFADGWGFHYVQGRVHYLNGLPSADSFDRLVHSLLDEHGIAVSPLPQGVRLRTRGNVRFAFNFGPGTQSLETVSGRLDAPPVFGGPELAPGEVAAWLS